MKNLLCILALVLFSSPAFSYSGDCPTFTEQLRNAEAAIKGEVIDVSPLYDEHNKPSGYYKITFKVFEWVKGDGENVIEVLGSNKYQMGKKYYSYVGVRKQHRFQKKTRVFPEVKYGFDGHFCGTYPSVEITE